MNWYGPKDCHCGCATNPCPHFCMPNGGSLCPIESTRRYVAQPLEGTIWLGTGDEMDVCCPALFTWLHGSGGEWENRSQGMENNDDNTDCIWLTPAFADFECDDGDGAAQLEITSGPEAILTVTIGSYTLVWLSDPGYDPLCISSFTYSEEDSNPPEDCAWPERFCVIPSESCCPDYGYPDTLYATVTIIRPGGACPDWITGEKVIELTRVTPHDPNYYPGSPIAVLWTGADELWPGGEVLAIELSCIRPGGGAYRMDMQFPLSGCAPDSQYANETPSGGFSSCVPFIFHFEDIASASNCCTGAFDMEIVVTE